MRTCERIGLDRRTHRRQALKLLMNLPKGCKDSDTDRATWIANVHDLITQLDLSLPIGSSTRKFFRKPPSEQWSSHLCHPEQLGLKCANIHEAKGHEYDAVCVVIPPKRADVIFDSWMNKTETEAKRVIYVGITRARYLAAVAIPQTHAECCVNILASNGVSFSRIDL